MSKVQTKTVVIDSTTPLDVTTTPISARRAAASTLDEAVMTRIEDNLALVKQVVFQVATHFPRHVDREELARAGALGLVEASQRWDEMRGVPFDRFAARRIRGAILDSVRSADWAPRSVRTLSRRMEYVGQELGNDLGRMPTTDEVAEALGVSPQRLSVLQDRVYRSVVLALDQFLTTDDDDDATFGDVLSTGVFDEPAEELETRELLSYLRDAVALLPERHRLVIVGYFMEGKTSFDLARFLGVTESRVSQLRSEALEMLRTGIKAQYNPSDQPIDLRESGKAARRQASYVEALGDASSWRNRLDLTDTALGSREFVHAL